MALETLNNVTEINSHKIIRLDEAKKDGNLFTDDKFDEHQKKFHILICDKENIISFKIQDGPIKEVGVNGCQIDDAIELFKKVVEGLNKKFPCRENSMMITKLDEALMWSEKRKKDREKRGVEGQSKA